MSKKFLLLRIIIFCMALWSRKIWAPDKSVVLKSCPRIFFRLISLIVMLVQLLVPSQNMLSRTLKKKPVLQLKTLKSGTACGYPWPRYIVLQWISFSPSIKSWYMRQQSCFSYVNFKSFSETSQIKKDSILPALELYN